MLILRLRLGLYFWLLPFYFS